MRIGGLSKLAAFFAERAMGGVGLMVTGGIAPNRAGTVYPFAANLTTSRQARYVVSKLTTPSWKTRAVVF